MFVPAYPMLQQLAGGLLETAMSDIAGKSYIVHTASRYGGTCLGQCALNISCGILKGVSLNISNNGITDFTHIEVNYIHEVEEHIVQQVGV